MVTSKECLAKWGSPLKTENQGKYMERWEVPLYIRQSIPILPKHIYCNKQMVVPLEVALLNVIERGLVDQFITWNGCFNIRKKRGKNSWSLHSWGIAIDINRETNGYNKKPQMSPELVKCFTDAGFEWGGNWTNPIDGMHFQLAYLTYHETN